MSKKDLLNRRIEVISLYPGCNFQLNEIIHADGSGRIMIYEDWGGWELDTETYPNLFREMNWWEERAKEEMPKFLKLFYNDKNQYVHKVEKWIGENSDGQSLYEFFNRNNYLSTACVIELLPATEEEYNEYLKWLNHIIN